MVSSAPSRPLRVTLIRNVRSSAGETGSALGIGRSLNLGESDDGQETGDDAVDGKGREGAGLEEADQESHGQVRGGPGEEAADQRLGANAVAEVAGEVGELVDARREDDRRGQEER